VEGPPCLSPIISAISDTGSTAHFCTVDTPVINKVLATAPIAVRNPYGSIIHSTHEAELSLHASVTLSLPFLRNRSSLLGNL
jgi:hypothetical protein